MLTLSRGCDAPSALLSSQALCSISTPNRLTILIHAFARQHTYTLLSR